MSASPSGDANAPTQTAPGAPPVRPSWETVADTGRPAAPPAARPAPVTPPLRYAPPPQYPAPPQHSAPPQALPDSPYSEESAQYDLAGNALPSTSPALSPYAPPASAYPGTIVSTQGTSWPPAPTAPGGWQPLGNGTDRIARLKWNWGAFLIPFWWSLFNGQKNIAAIIFLTNIGSRFIPAPFDWLVVIGQFGLQIYLGAMGHRLAWTSDRFAGDYDSYIRTQRAWMIWGFVLAGLIGGGLVLMFSLVPGFLGTLAGGSSPAPHTSSYGGSHVGSP